MNIIQAIKDPKIFGSLFKDLRSWTAWMVCLKAIFAIPMSKEELKIYAKYTGRRIPPRTPFKEAFLIIGRRGGKSFIAALVIVFLAVFIKWDLGLEKGYIMCIASDRKQASIVFHYVRKILQLPAFRNMVVNETKEEIELSNDIVIAIHTCSYRSLRGYQICASVCDEINFYRTLGANPAAEILNAMRPSLNGIKGSILLAISSAYSKSGPLWEAYRDKFGVDNSEVLVWKGSTADMNTTYPIREIEKALKNDYHVARAEFFSEFRADIQSYLSDEEVESVVIRGRFELPPIAGVRYHAFCDPSGGKRDSMTLSVCHLEGTKAVQDCMKVWNAPFNPSNCVTSFAQVLKSYGIYQIHGDRYSGAWCSSEFEKHGILYEPAQLNKSQLFLEFLTMVMRRAVEILDNRTLTNQLMQLERKTGGVQDSIGHAPGLMDDAANALAGCCVMAVQQGERLPPPNINLHERELSDIEKMDRQAVRWLQGKPPLEDDRDNFNEEEWDINQWSCSEVSEFLDAEEKKEK
jgi:hypothetical protein